METNRIESSEERETRVRLECLRLVYDYQPDLHFEDKINLARDLSNFALGNIDTERNGCATVADVAEPDKAEEPTPDQIARGFGCATKAQRDRVTKGDRIEVPTDLHGHKVFRPGTVLDADSNMLTVKLDKTTRANWSSTVTLHRYQSTYRPVTDALFATMAPATPVELLMEGCWQEAVVERIKWQHPRLVTLLTHRNGLPISYTFPMEQAVNLVRWPVQGDEG